MSNFINQFSKHLQSELNLNEERTEVVIFGLYTFFSTVAGFAAVIVIGYLIGELKLSLTAATTISIFRSVSGGAHSKQLRNCTILGAMVSPGIAIICKLVSPMLTVLVLSIIIAVVWLFSLRSVFEFAPADTPKRPITRPDERKKFRRLSFAFLIIWIIAVLMVLVLKPYLNGFILASTLGLLWQVYSITPDGYRLVNRFDKFLS